MTTDILVVGAGPAGATVARLLAAGGRQVVLLEKERVPRRKPCGGGLPARTVQALGLDLTSVTLATIRSVAIDGAWGGRQRYALDTFSDLGTGDTAPPAVVVERSRFDAFLVRQARDAGAQLLEETPCRGVERTAAGFTVTTDGGGFFCRTLCICDGVASPTGRSLGFPANPTGFCLEGTLPFRADIPAEAASCAIVNLTCLQRGYAWAFPRGAEFAVGIGGSVSKAPDMQARLAGFIARTPELRGGVVQNLRGCFLPDFRAPRPRYAEAGACLLGDAAGFADPLTGEGIFHAVRSAQLAADAILGGSADAYDALVREKLLPELLIARHYAARFHGIPRLVRAVAVSLPPGRRHVHQFAKLLLGNSTYAEMYRTFHGGRAFVCGR